MHTAVDGNPLNLVDPLGLCGWRDPWNCADDVAEGVGDGVRTVWNAPAGERDWGTTAAGVVNVVYGSYKVFVGISALTATPIAASIPFIGPVTGTAAAFYGGYQVITGCARIYRGANVESPADMGPEDQTIGANVERFVSNFVPGQGLMKFLGGLP